MRVQWRIIFTYTNGVVEEVQGYDIAELLDHAREVFNKNPTGTLQDFDVQTVYPDDWKKES